MGSCIVIGGGLVGQFVAVQLAKHRDVCLFDISQKVVNEAHSNRIEARKCDILSENDPFTDLEVEVAVNAVPGYLGHAMRTRLIEVGIPLIIDLAFSEEDPTTLSKLTQASHSRLIPDSGIAPGLSNMLLAVAVERLGPLSHAEIIVGGNPTEPDDEWSYMAPFSPVDVIEEYTRPARIIQGGKIKTVPALSERKCVEVDGIGTLEAALTDGLRTVLTTIPSENMSEWTLRWPQHWVRWNKSGDTLDPSSLIKAWHFDHGRDEHTWMQVSAENSNGQIKWIVEDHGDERWSSMARATGFVSWALAFRSSELIKNIGPGVHPPESLPSHLRAMILSELDKIGLSIFETENAIS